MEINEIKKALYREKPMAHLMSLNKDSAKYACSLGSDVVVFVIPYSDMGNQVFSSKEPAQLLIRWLLV